MPELFKDRKTIILFAGGVVLGILILGIIWVAVGSGEDQEPTLSDVLNGENLNGESGEAEGVSGEIPMPVEPDGGIGDGGAPPEGSAQGQSSLPGPRTELVGSYAYAENQRAGSEVRISMMRLEEPLWVAVRSVSEEGLGNVLGAHWLPAGSASGSVRLIVPTEPASSYAIVLFRDNGDKLFHRESETPVRNNNLEFTGFQTLP